MITKINLEKLLIKLNFKKHGVAYSKAWDSALIEINFSKEEISYPEAQGMVVNERQTCNFSANENFVVLECVIRLLEKGYKPQHIELEPKWKLGHGASGGRADILIKDNDGKTLLIIECKTPGAEFKKAWAKTLGDGDQLFSYAQQISETQYLSLYSSDLNNEELNYSSYIIAHRDNEKYLTDNPSLKSFKSVSDVKERYDVWNKTYKLDYTTKGIFEANIQPYHIGKDKYSLDDLQTISAEDQQRKYHEFATILRQHNVSGRENAFDKLVNLFLCKLVDETENPNDLKFYWKGVAYDTHFELLDRLQQLYQAGMAKFLGEDITYINQYDVKNALRFIRKNPDATQRAVWNLFIQQKFFTNNDFSLIDVHNEKLFYQNAEVLLKILQMWQDIRLTNPSGHNQFLGDMFEGFLDQGVKQSEGQYFTPMPICRFLLMSLPLETIIEKNDAPFKAIDYACGAGHFLNELALQINPLVEKLKPGVTLDTYHKTIFGIEKEYRLSKVAKVSAFMYGQQDINICYGDALIKQHEAFPEIKDDSFDLLIANPPYSVKGFLETLPELDRESFTLTKITDSYDTFNSIETFFIERAKQLLRGNGVAAIILPSSILSNGNNAYVKAREILLKYFDIVAITELGSGTFGKTGTNTVTLFLRRKKTNPDAAEHYKERVSEWFKGCENDKHKQVAYQDEHLIDQYADRIGITATDYKTLLQGDYKGSWLNQDYFQEYTKKFSSEAKNIVKQKWYKLLNPTDQKIELQKLYLNFVHKIEMEKLYFYVLANDQPNPVLVIRSPSGKEAFKQFLGYTWSSTKGDEGIKLIKDKENHHLTLLYDEIDRNNIEKLNRLIVDNFNGATPEIPVSLSKYANHELLENMLNFSTAEFEKQISIVSGKSVRITTMHPTAKLQDVAKIVNGGTPDTKNAEFWEKGTICWATLKDTKDKYILDTERKITKEGLKATNLLPLNSVIFSSRATIGKVCINKVPIATNQGFKSFICDPNKIEFEYLFYLLEHLRPAFEGMIPHGSKYKEINTKTINQFKIPLPSISEQKTIVKKCLDAEASAAKIIGSGTPLKDAQKEIDKQKKEIFKNILTISI
jgi:type I restriction enzyme M protein